MIVKPICRCYDPMCMPANGAWQSATRFGRDGRNGQDLGVGALVRESLPDPDHEDVSKRNISNNTQMCAAFVSLGESSFCAKEENLREMAKEQPTSAELRGIWSIDAGGQGLACSAGTSGRLRSLFQDSWWRWRVGKNCEKPRGDQEQWLLLSQPDPPYRVRRQGGMKPVGADRRPRIGIHHCYHCYYSCELTWEPFDCRSSLSAKLRPCGA